MQAHDDHMWIQRGTLHVHLFPSFTVFGDEQSTHSNRAVNNSNEAVTVAV